MGRSWARAQTWDAVYRGYDPVKEFLKGKTAFLLHESWVLNQQIKAGAQDTNMEYGMVPYPIGPDAKDYTSDSRNNRLFTLIRTNKDYEKSAVIFNALARPLGDEKAWITGTTYRPTISRPTTKRAWTCTNCAWKRPPTIPARR